MEDTGLVFYLSLSLSSCAGPDSLFLSSSLFIFIVLVTSSVDDTLHSAREGHPPPSHQKRESPLRVPPTLRLV